MARMYYGFSLFFFFLALPYAVTETPVTEKATNLDPSGLSHHNFGKDDVPSDSAQLLRQHRKLNVPPTLYPATTVVHMFTICRNNLEEIEAVRRKEEACVVLLTQATKRLGEARRRKAAAEKDFEERQEGFNQADETVKMLEGSIRATRSQLRRGGNRIQLSRQLRQLQSRRRQAIRERSLARNRLGRARRRLMEAEDEEDTASGRVASLQETLTSVRLTLESLTNNAIPCVTPSPSPMLSTSPRPSAKASTSAAPDGLNSVPTSSPSSTPTPSTS